MEDKRDYSTGKTAKRGLIYRMKRLSKIYTKQAPVGGFKRAVFLSLPVFATVLILGVVVAQVVSAGKVDKVSFATNPLPVINFDNTSDLEIRSIEAPISRELNGGTGVKLDLQAAEMTGLVGANVELFNASTLALLGSNRPTTPHDMWVNADDVNLRLTADPNSEVVATVMKGDKIQGFPTVAEFTKVTTANNVEGFIATKYISAEAVEASYHSKNVSVWVKVDLANVREKADTSSPVVTQVAYGDEITQIQSNGTWSEIKTSAGKQGYMKDELFQTEGIVKWTNKTVYVKGDVVNVRETASTSSNIVTKVYYAEKLTQVGESKDSENNSWAKVETSGGKVGFILGSFVQDSAISTPTKPSPAPAPVPGVLGSASDAADLALSFCGVPYVFGGTSPSGFDCSGLVYYCYRQYGMRLPRCADDQAVATKKITRDQLQKGDLCFFGSYGGSTVGHVGIYVGGGKFVHAPDEGQVVRVQALGGYYTPLCYGRVG